MMCLYKFIVPYRDRPQHLPSWSKIDNVLFVEQCDDQPFNRAKLLNIGAIESMAEYFIFNDVDLIPMQLPSFQKGVTQLASSVIQTNGYLGGSTMIDRDTFFKIGGYRNDYFHRAEDNELYFHLLRSGVHISHQLIPFLEQPHDRPKVEFDVVLWLKAQRPRMGLNSHPITSCKYRVVSRTERWIQVEI